jgi:cellulose synthase/poly-beta-1,6-N-acetylglucosamine synthase-like glycosyltransferase
MSDFLFEKAATSIAFFSITIGFSLLAPVLFAVIAVGISLVIPNSIIDTTFLTLYFLIACTLYNILILFIAGLGRLEDGDDVAHFFSIIVPARNEELVINETLRRVFAFDYPSELFEVVVLNDGSTDNTESLVRDEQKNHPNLKLINVSQARAGHGKGSALNRAFGDFLLTWRGLEIEPRHRWIIGVFDSDAIPDPNMLRKVSFEFRNPRVGGVQTLVRISNRKKSFLAKLQDMEFLAFARLLQFSRTVFGGSVALGGTGQFIRATALDTTALTESEEYWNCDSLTEDLDIGIRLMTNKWENRYVETTAVNQEGVENFSSLIHQRTRWAWGALQALRIHILSFRIWRANISLRKKLDTSVYLINIIVPFLVICCWVLSGLSLLGIVRVSNVFPWVLTLANGFSFLPLYFYGLWKEKADYPAWQIIPLTLIGAVYTYHWVPCISIAAVKMVTKKPVWKKTPRFKKAG